MLSGSDANHANESQASCATVLRKPGDSAVLIGGDERDLRTFETGSVGHGIDRLLPSRRDRTVGRDDFDEHDHRLGRAQIGEDQIGQVLVGLDPEPYRIGDTVIPQYDLVAAFTEPKDCGFRQVGSGENFDHGTCDGGTRTWCELSGLAAREGHQHAGGAASGAGQHDGHPSERTFAEMLPLEVRDRRHQRIALQGRIEQGSEIGLQRVARKARCCRQILAAEHGANGDKTVTQRFVANGLAGVVGVPAIAGYPELPAEHANAVRIAIGLAGTDRLLAGHAVDMHGTKEAVGAFHRADVKGSKHGAGRKFADAVGAVGRAIREYQA